MKSGLAELTIAYQGEPGAYSEGAAMALFPGSRTTGYRTFAMAFEALGEGQVQAAVLPVENTLGGIVQEVNDLLWETPGLRVTGEHVHPVRHCLIGAPGEVVTRALSHPQALSQCRHWLRERGIEEVVGHDTAGSVRELAEHPQPGLGAIASAEAAARYGLSVLAEGIQDDASNRTRFLVIDRGRPRRPGVAAPGSKTSLAFIAAHRPGSLVRALQALSDRGVNLSRLDSRPLSDRPFEYRFYMDFEVQVSSAAEAALNGLETETSELRLFGTYPAFVG